MFDSLVHPAIVVNVNGLVTPGGLTLQEDDGRTYGWQPGLNGLDIGTGLGSGNDAAVDVPHDLTVPWSHWLTIESSSGVGSAKYKQPRHDIGSRIDTAMGQHWWDGRPQYLEVIVGILQEPAGLDPKITTWQDFVDHTVDVGGQCGDLLAVADVEEQYPTRLSAKVHADRIDPPTHAISL